MWWWISGGGVSFSTSGASSSASSGKDGGRRSSSLLLSSCGKRGKSDNVRADASTQRPGVLAPLPVTSCLRAATSRSLLSLACLLARSPSAFFLFSSSEALAMFSKRAFRFPAPALAAHGGEKTVSENSTWETSVGTSQTNELTGLYCLRLFVRRGSGVHVGEANRALKGGQRRGGFTLGIISQMLR